jgi:hypothetical protein
MITERIWDGSQITEPGIYAGVSLAEYHDNPALFDGPSISKSSIKHLLPAHGGSPKAFWGRWRHNPDHIEQKSSDALSFGKAAHCLLLGDEVFADSFVIRPEEFPDYKGKAARDWRDAQLAAGKTIVTPADMDRIRMMRDDAARYPLVQQGILNGAVERTMAWKDPETGIWLKVRPDVIPVADGVYADLKTAADFSEDFLERQAFDAGYYLQGAMIRMVCRALELPFTTFALLYVLKDDVPDTAHVEISEHELDRGEREIRWALHTIRRCLDAGEWPGARPFQGGERPLQLKPWAKQKIDDFLDMENAA